MPRLAFIGKFNIPQFIYRNIEYGGGRDIDKLNMVKEKMLDYLIDYVFSFSLIEYLQKSGEDIKEVHKVLKKRGS
jgi:hypothetical protein